jgi:hypothetical protein
MSRLINIQPVPRELPASLTLSVGDVMLFAASGGHVLDGVAVELRGSFVESVLGTDGRVHTPMGPPNVVLFFAREPGQAVIDIVTGDPWHSPATRRMTVVVQV